MRSHALVMLLATVGVCSTGAVARADDAKRVDVQVVLAETYDSNVSRSDTAVAGLRGISPSDEIFAPTITADLRLPFGQQTFFLNGSAGYEDYSRNHILSNGRVTLDTGVDAHVGICSGKVSGEYDYQQSDLQDLTVAITRNVVNIGSVSLDATCGAPVGLAPTASVSEQWATNSAEELVSSDYNHLSTSAGLSYRRPNFGVLSLLGTYDQTNYPNRDLLPDDEAPILDGYSSYGVSLRYNRHLGARIEGTVSIGYDVVRPELQASPGYSGLTYGVDVTMRVSPRLNLHAALSRAAEPSVLQGVTYSIQNMYTGDLAYTLGPRVKVTMGAFDRSDHYTGADLISGVDIASEQSWGVNGSLRVAIGRRLAVQLDAWHENRHANLTEFNYSDDRASLSLSAAI